MSGAAVCRWRRLRRPRRGRLPAPPPAPQKRTPTRALTHTLPLSPPCSKKVDWDQLESQLKQEEAEEKLEGDAALNKFFRRGGLGQGRDGGGGLAAALPGGVPGTCVAHTYVLAAAPLPPPTSPHHTPPPVRDLYEKGDDDTRRAMVKSMQESGVPEWSGAGRVGWGGVGWWWWGGGGGGGGGVGGCGWVSGGGWVGGWWGAKQVVELGCHDGIPLLLCPAPQVAPRCPPTGRRWQTRSTRPAAAMMTDWSVAALCESAPLAYIAEERSSSDLDALEFRVKRNFACSAQIIE